MNRFEINPRLKQDSFELGLLNDQIVLLGRNALVPWFIVLPLTRETELYRLEQQQRQTLNDNIDLLSEFIVDHFKVDKLNVASTGNVVEQMHVHIVGRYRNDPMWPGVVWGGPASRAYSAQEVDAIIQQLLERFGSRFTVAPGALEIK
jgi:diadenosine tetraphosphate (Ap4A) HIT family hydrolase